MLELQAEPLTAAPPDAREKGPARQRARSGRPVEEAQRLRLAMAHDLGQRIGRKRPAVARELARTPCFPEPRGLQRPGRPGGDRSEGARALGGAR